MQRQPAAERYAKRRRAARLVGSSVAVRWFAGAFPGNTIGRSSSRGCTGTSWIWAERLLVIRFFMHVRYGRKLVYVFVAAGFFGMLLMITLTMGDYLTRQMVAGG